jgi:hypothetical protein
MLDSIPCVFKHFDKIKIKNIITFTWTLASLHMKTDCLNKYYFNQNHMLIPTVLRKTIELNYKTISQIN